MKISLSRRRFVQSASLFSVVPFSSYSLSPNKQKNCFFKRDLDGNVFIVENVFPFEKKLILESNTKVRSFNINTKKDLCLFIGDLTGMDSPYILFISVEKLNTIYRFVTVENHERLSGSFIQNVIEINGST